MDCGTPDFPVHHQLLELAQTHIHQVGVAIQPSHPLSSPPPPAFYPRIGVFSKESVLCKRGTKYWSFSTSPSNEYSGLISFRIDRLHLLAVQGTLKSLLQYHSLKTPVLQCSAFFMVQLTSYIHDYWKTIALTRQTFILLSRLVIAFLPRSKCLLISWLQSWNKQCDKIFHFSSWECCQKTLLLSKLF